MAVSFRRKRVTNWSTLLPPSYTCGGKGGGTEGKGVDEGSDTPAWGHRPRATAGRQGLRTPHSIYDAALRTERQKAYKMLSTGPITQQTLCERQLLTQTVSDDGAGEGDGGGGGYSKGAGGHFCSAQYRKSSHGQQTRKGKAS